MEDPKSKRVLLFICGLLLGIVILGIILLFFYFKYSFKSTPPETQPAQSKPPTPIQPPSTKKPIAEKPEKVEIDQKRIAYIDNNNVWVINMDGSNKKQLTFDGNSDISYANLEFKDKDNLSYVKCPKSENCSQIFTQSLKTSSTTLEEQISSEDAYFLGGIAWSKDGQKLAYIYSDPEQTRFIYVKQNGVAKKIKEIEMKLGGRGGSFDDAQYLEFSPQGEKLLVVYTFNLPLDEPSIFIFDVSSGAELLSLGKVDNLWSTQAFFLDEQNIGLKRGDKIMKVNINTSEETQLVFAPNNYNPVLSPDKDFIAFWTYTDSESADLHLFDFASGSIKLGEGMSNPQWLSEETLVAYNVTTCEECMFNYNVVGLTKIDRLTKTKTSLVNSENLTGFAVSPQLIF